jgi:hypothetical protein
MLNVNMFLKDLVTRHEKIQSLPWKLTSEAEQYSTVTLVLPVYPIKCGQWKKPLPVTYQNLTNEI